MTREPLWEVRAKRSVVKCVLQVETTWTELLLLQDEDVAARELFQDNQQARDRATLLREQLLKRGWRQAS